MHNNFLKKADMKSKKKLIFWLVSDCETDNKREEYAKMLNKFIPVDIYGKCNWKETINKTIPDGKEAYKILQKEYKFYLAFENSNCYDYISEKFSRTMGHGIVPIVMGGSNNYKRFAPENSYINVIDFKSPEHLAEYLKQLDMNDNEYLKYFKWIKNYRIFEPLQWCQLCRKLNNAKESKKSYSNITDWWIHDPNKKLACDV